MEGDAEMPRVEALRPQYMAKDIGSNIVGLMFRKKICQTELAKELGLTQGGLHYKLMNNSFSYKDLIIIFHQLELTDEEIVRLMKV